MSRLTAICEYKSLILKAVYGQPALDPKEIFDHLMSYAERLRPMVCDTARFLNRAIADG